MMNYSLIQSININYVNFCILKNLDDNLGNAYNTIEAKTSAHNDYNRF